MKLQGALDVAAQMERLIGDVCERFEVAGSARRKKSECGDLELVVIPKFETTVITTLMTEETATVDRLRERMTELREKGIVNSNRPSKDNRRSPFGPRYYRINLTRHGSDIVPQVEDIPVDLFVVLPPADWGVIFAIRTGSADYSYSLVDTALRKGMKVQDGQLFKIQDGYLKKIPCPEECNLFDALGIEYVLPEERNI